MASDALTSTFGALYLGAVVATTLFGFTTNLAFDYFRKYYKKDAFHIKLLVGGLWIVDAFQVVLLMHFTWNYIVTGYANPAALQKIVWSFGLELAMTVTVSFTVRSFYMSQLWGLSRENVYILTAALVFAIGQLALGWLIGVKMIRDPRINLLHERSYRWTMGAKCTTALVSDILITASTCWYLHTSRTGFRKTNELINQLLVYTTNRGVIATLWEAIVLSTFISMRSNLVFAALHLLLGKLHVASLFMLLNHRETLRLRAAPNDNSLYPSLPVQNPISQTHRASLSMEAIPSNVQVMVTSEVLVDASYADRKSYHEHGSRAQTSGKRQLVNDE